MKKFEGRDTIGASVKITNAGDGLSAAMEVDAVELKLGDKVWIVLEGEVTRIAHQPAKESKGVVRVQTIKAGVATLVEEDLVKEVLEDQRIALEQASGVVRLGFDDPDALEPGEPGDD
jgi:hypothetical protein